MMTMVSSLGEASGPARRQMLSEIATPKVAPETGYAAFRMPNILVCWQCAADLQEVTNTIQLLPALDNNRGVTEKKFPHNLF